MDAVVGMEYSGGPVAGPVVVAIVALLVLLADEEVDNLEVEDKVDKAVCP